MEGLAHRNLSRGTRVIGKSLAEQMPGQVEDEHAASRV